MDKTRDFLDSVREIITTKDYDWLHVIVGPEGIGKTSLGWSMCKHIDPDFNGHDDAVFSYKELVDAVDGYTGKAILIDEGAMVFYSRESMNSVNKKAIKLMTAIRTKNLFIVICIPNFWILDKYIREHRVKTVSRVVKRGWQWHFSPRTVKFFVRDKKRPIQTIWPPFDFRDSFPDASKLWPDEWAEYKKKKESLSTKPDNAKEGATNRKCSHCGYRWNYGGKLKSPTCPSCKCHTK